MPTPSAVLRTWVTPSLVRSSRLRAAALHIAAQCDDHWLARTYLPPTRMPGNTSSVTLRTLAERDITSCGHMETARKITEPRPGKQPRHPDTADCDEDRGQQSSDRCKHQHCST